jgi:hypothetical protein
MGSYPLVVALPGQVWGLAAPDAAGPLIVTSIDGCAPSRTVRTAVDLSGAVLWRHEIGGHPLPALVSTGNGWCGKPKGMLMFTRTALGPLDTGCTPCGTGNTIGNRSPSRGTVSSAVTPRPPAHRR